MVAGVVKDHGHIDILLNMKLTKGPEDVVKALAHELVHLIRNDEGHEGDFLSEWQKLEKELWSEYVRI